LHVSHIEIAASFVFSVSLGPMYIDLASPGLASASPLKLKARIQEIIDEAAWNKPSVIILDNLHAVCPPEDEVCI
jgi:hypothetical protein